MTFAGIVTGFCVIGFAVYYGIGWIKGLAGDSAIYIVGACWSPQPISALLKYATTYPELEMDDPNNPVLELPETGSDGQVRAVLPAADRRSDVVPDRRALLSRPCRHSGPRC